MDNIVDMLNDVPYAAEEIYENDAEVEVKAFTQSEMKELLEDIKFYINFDEDNMKKMYSIIADDYLAVEDLNYNNEKINSDFQMFLNTYSDKKDLHDLKKQILKTNYEVKYPNIGPVSSLDYLVETSFKSDYSRKKSIIDNLVIYDDFIYRWRNIGGDGNCYYRAVIFAYLENLIFEGNLSLLQYFILDIYNLFNKDELVIKKLNEHNIKGDLVIKILVLLYYSLLVGKLQTYEIFLRCFINCKAFDLGLIFYFRFKIYQFIKLNENKLYSKEFSVKIGNLLPFEYETKSGEFLYEKFYEDYLLKLYEDAEKIVIYITPFILKVNINILVYDFCKNNIEKLKEFPCLFPSNKPTLTLLYKRTHYDLIYEQKYFQKYYKYLTLYVNLHEELKVITADVLEEVSKIKKNNLISMQTSAEITKNQVLPDITDTAKIINYKDINMNTSVLQLFKETESERNQLININDNLPLTTIQPKLNCIICKNFYVPYQTVYKLCKNCLISELKTNTLSKYINFLQVSKANLKEKKTSDLGKIFKLIFFENKVKLSEIDSEPIPVQYAFKLADLNFNDFLTNEIKSNICSSCENLIDLKSSSIFTAKLPCCCSLCSFNCLKSHLELIFNGITNNREILCICSRIYNLEDLKLLLYLCHSNSLRNYKEKILDIFRDRIASLCMLCLNEKKIINGIQVVVWKLRDETIDKILGIKSFSHFMCKDCFKDHFKDNPLDLNTKYQTTQSLFCMICNAIHSINSYKLKNVEQSKIRCGIL